MSDNEMGSIITFHTPLLIIFQEKNLSNIINKLKVSPQDF